MRWQVEMLTRDEEAAVDGGVCRWVQRTNATRNLKVISF